MFRLLIFAMLCLPVWACSCDLRRSAKEAWIESALVFAGIVEKTSENADPDGEQIGWVRVVEPFKGVKLDQVVELRHMANPCFRGYERGSTRLFYVIPGEQKGTWLAPACHGRLHLENAVDDLRFLRGLPDSARNNRVSGTVQLRERDSVQGSNKVLDLAGVTVRAVNAEIRKETVTDAQGWYEFRDLPTGTYEIQIDAPKGTRIDSPHPYGKTRAGNGSEAPSRRDKALLDVTETSGNGYNFVLLADTRIAGRVFDPAGKPMKDVCVEIDPVQEEPQDWSWASGCTDADGAYVLEMMPAGSYRLVVNRDGQMTARKPYGQLYFPGTADVTKARVLTVAVGQHIGGADLHIPEFARRIELRGRLVFSDGVPLPQEAVEFVGNDQSSWESALTDEHGHFTMRILAGRAGKLSSVLSIQRGDSFACPQFGVRIDGASQWADVRSIPTPIAGDASVSGVDVVFPFASCERWLKGQAEIHRRFKR